MTSSIRILVVDDDFATLEFLRSILALAQDDFDVLGVPSAEEALLALRRAPFQLLITDVRLPGISGLELVRAAREFRPDLPVILITAYALSEVDQEVITLNVANYFHKPLDAEDFLEAVFTVVESQDPVTSQDPDLTLASIIAKPDAVSERLELLRTDTGARQVVMASTAGELLYIAGLQPDFDLRQVVASMAASVNTSLRLASELSQERPLAIQFLSGETCDLYFTNIDHNFFVAIFIDSQNRRGRIGTIWVFTQRAVRDIRRLIPDMQRSLDIEADQAQDFLTSDRTTSESLNELSDMPIKGKEELMDESRSSADQSEVHEAESISVDALIETAPGTEVLGHVPLPDTNFESLIDQISTEEEYSDQPESLIDDFWDEALNTDSENVSSGLSLDEAREQGLIGPEFDAEED